MIEAAIAIAADLAVRIVIGFCCIGYYTGLVFGLAFAILLLVMVYLLLVSLFWFAFAGIAAVGLFVFRALIRALLIPLYDPVLMFVALADPHRCGHLLVAAITRLASLAYVVTSVACVKIVFVAIIVLVISGFCPGRLPPDGVKILTFLALCACPLTLTILMWPLVYIDWQAAARISDCAASLDLMATHDHVSYAITAVLCLLAGCASGCNCASISVILSLTTVCWLLTCTATRPFLSQNQDGITPKTSEGVSRYSPGQTAKSIISQVGTIIQVADRFVPTHVFKPWRLRKTDARSGIECLQDGTPSVVAAAVYEVDFFAFTMSSLVYLDADPDKPGSMLRTEPYLPDLRDTYADENPAVMAGTYSFGSSHRRLRDNPL